VRPRALGSHLVAGHQNCPALKQTRGAGLRAVLLEKDRGSRVVSHAGGQASHAGRGDPASPVDPKLKRKFITTTWVSALLFAPFWIAVHFHLISLGMLRNFG